MAANETPKIRYPVPGATFSSPWATWLTIRKSRFLTRTCRCSSPAEARAFIAWVKSASPDATHNCWAFAAGAPGDGSSAGFSDDGEPHGTAGRPMLGVLLGSGIGEICAVASRWFGGIKLGTGGLARAYQDCVRENLAELPLAENIPMARVRAVLPYSSLDSLRRLLPRFEGAIESGEYGERAELSLSIPEDRAADFRAAAAAAVRTLQLAD